MILSCLSPTSVLIKNRILLTTTQKMHVSQEETGWQIKKIGSSIDEIKSFRFSFLFSPLTHSSQRRVVLIPRQRKEPVFSTVQTVCFFSPRRELAPPRGTVAPWKWWKQSRVASQQWWPMRVGDREGRQRGCDTPRAKQRFEAMEVVRESSGWKRRGEW